MVGNQPGTAKGTIGTLCPKLSCMLGNQPGTAKGTLGTLCPKLFRMIVNQPGTARIGKRKIKSSVFFFLRGLSFL